MDVIKRSLMNAAFKEVLSFVKENVPLSYHLQLPQVNVRRPCLGLLMEEEGGGGGYITSAFTDETVASWVRSFLAQRNNGISLLLPCVITRWFATFCGKDASCYCLTTCILNSTVHKRHKHTCGRKRLQSRRPPHPHPLATVICADPCCSNTFCPIFCCAALTDCPVDSGPNCQAKWKQTGAGEERLQEAICFYKVDMGRAGLFCWKWLSSSVLPWPGAVGRLRARRGRRERRRRLPATWLSWQPEHAAIHRWPSQLRLTLSSRQCGVSAPPAWKIAPLSYTRVYHKHMPPFGPIGGASGSLSFRHLQPKHDLTSPHKAKL